MFIRSQHQGHPNCFSVRLFVICPLLACLACDTDEGAAAHSCGTGFTTLECVDVSAMQGQPTTTTLEFNAGVDKTYCVDFSQGKEKPDRVTSALLLLNDAIELFTPSDFNQQVDVVSRTFSVEPGLHHLSFETRGTKTGTGQLCVHESGSPASASIWVGPNLPAQKLEVENLRLEFPAGATAEPTEVTCTATGPHSYECGPHGTNFLKPVTVRIAFPDHEITDIGGTLVGHEENVLHTVISSTERAAYAQISHFSPILLYFYPDFMAAIAEYDDAYAEDLDDDANPKRLEGQQGVIQLPRQGDRCLANDGNCFQLLSGDYYRLRFPKGARERYTICTRTKSGDVALYSSWEPGVTDMSNGTNLLIAENKLEDAARFSSDANGSGGDECIAVDTNFGGVLYVAVHAKTDAKFDLYVAKTRQHDNPKTLNGKLIWPIAGYTEPTFHKFGPFNSPWGNHYCDHDPYFDSGPSQIHNATDIYAPAETPVKTACSGVLKTKPGVVWGPIWGDYIGQECEVEGETYSILYGHLSINASAAAKLANAEEVDAEFEIGDVYKMTKKGEIDHIHLALCRGTFDECEIWKVATPETFGERTFTGTAHPLFINAGCQSNPSIYQSDSRPLACEAAMDKPVYAYADVPPLPPMQCFE